MRLSVARRSGPRNVVDALYRKHVGDVYRYVLAVIGDPDDAEDVTQTTFLNAFRALERGDEVREPKAWLRAIAHNVCRQRFRQVSRRPSEVPFDDDAGELVEERHGPTAQDVARALTHLPFNQRAALVMRELEGRSPREIAEALGVTLGATETLLFRARRSLREQIEGSLTCEQAEEAISLQADGLLARPERGALRAHLRECSECARTAKSVRAQRGALKALAAVPLPPALALASGFGAAGGGTAVVSSIFGKLAIGGVAATLLAGGTVEVASKHPWSPAEPARPASTHAGAPARPVRRQNSTPLSGSTIALVTRPSGHHRTPAAGVKADHLRKTAKDSIPRDRHRATKAKREGAATPRNQRAPKAEREVGATPRNQRAPKVKREQAPTARTQHAAEVKREEAATPRKQHAAEGPVQHVAPTSTARKQKASATTTHPTPPPTKPARGAQRPAGAARSG